WHSYISRKKMLSKSVIVVVIFSFHVRWLNCGKATVPFKVCEKYIDYPVSYTFNSTVNNSVFKDAEDTLELLHGQLEAINSSKCNDPINLTITRTLHYASESNEEFAITANYTVTIGIKQVYRSNYSVLNSIRGKIEECSGQVVNDILVTESFESGLALNISGKIIEAKFDTINDDRKNQYCDLNLHYGCPTDSKEVNMMCECSQGTYLDVNVTTCTPCPKDTYQENTGMFNCTKCEAGHTTLNTTGRRNKTACTPVIPPSSTPSQPPLCSEGKYLKTISQTCLPCPKDFYKNKPGNTPCEPCPNGQVTSGQGASLCIDEGRDINVLAIALPISVLVLLMVAGVIFFVFRRKIEKEQERKDRDDFVRTFLEQLPPNRPTDIEANDYHITSNPHYEEHSNDEISNLGHLKEDVANRNLDIPRDCITLTRVRLGRGQFGEVQQVLVRKPGEHEILCAAKMARGSRVSLEDMLDELEIHLKLEDKHENVVNLIGVCSSAGGPFYLIVEYCDNGSLIDYLKKYDEPSHDYVNTANRETLSQEWKQRRTLEICNGMKYLANHKIVHRDLAARNILLDSNTVAQISDFGMAKDVYLKSYYKQQSEGCFPLRWMAIESIKSLQFNEKTDVWSFGVLVWEIFTHGNLPYYDIIDDQKVALYILSGKKLKRPQDCPKFLYNIMLKCWSTKNFNRPKFWELYKNLNENIQYQPKHGKATQRRVSRDIMKRFSNTKRSLKRKMSRKGSTRSEASIEPHTSRTPSHDRLCNDVELNERNHQLPKNRFFNSGAEDEIEVDITSTPTKEIDLVEEDENQDVETLENNEEKKLEPHLGDNDCLGDNPQCSSNDETAYNSSNTKEISSPSQNENQDIKDITYNQQNNYSEVGMSLLTTDSNELEEGNTLPKSDDSSSENSENNPADIVGLGIDERPKTDGDHTKTPTEGVTQTDDSTSKNESFLATDLDDVSVDISETLGDTTTADPADLTDNLTNDRIDASEKMTTDSLAKENLNQNRDETDNIKNGLDSADLENLDGSSDKVESEDEQKSIGGGDFLDDVLHAVVNVLQKNDNEFASSQDKTEKADTLNSSSC
ncbi:fibroblast growth factor receptor, partial [Paramuricea clavata]